MAPAVIRFHPAAAQEAESAYDWYAARSKPFRGAWLSRGASARGRRCCRQSAHVASPWKPCPTVRLPSISLQLGIVRNSTGAEEPVKLPGCFELPVHRRPANRRRRATRSWIARRSRAAMSPSVRVLSQMRQSASYSARAASTLRVASRRSVSRRSRASAARCPSRNRLRSSRETTRYSNPRGDDSLPTDLAD